MLGNIPGTDCFHDLHHYKESMKIPGFLILRIEAPTNFANSTYLDERVLRWTEEYEAEDYNRQSSLRFLILEMSVCQENNFIMSFYVELLRLSCLQLVWVIPLGEVMEKLQKSDEAGEFIRPNCLFLTVVAKLSATIEVQP
ncbi:hypothetical protein V6N13_014577 [Hibiscus sabdariffa]